eukprot:TRINITY_DN38918_c0_g1_i1.p1 TRINITY_DN38918_c0_g1~~TRINITY_DN38918_c0_g1_i1.p1  ORF type:complete len:473 (+),score=69.04 TRINITY_DN38918_c0_g1_i1:47-1420(+)
MAEEGSPMNDVIRLGSDMSLLQSTDLELLRHITFPTPFSEDHKEQLRNVVDARRSEYIILFIKLLNNIKKCVDTILDFLLVLIENTNFTEEWANISTKTETVDPITPFMPYLDSRDGSLLSRVYPVFAAILCVCDVEKFIKPINQALDFCIVNLRGINPSALEISVHALTFLMRNRAIRRLLRKKHALTYLVELVVAQSDSVQLAYEIGFCLWMLSYDDKAVRDLLKLQIIAKLHDMLRTYKKEKVARIGLMTLTNLVNLQNKIESGRTSGEWYYIGYSDDEQEDDRDQRINIYQDMIGLGMVRTLTIQSKKTFADPDINKMIDNILEILEKNIDETTSFADYKQEVLSGRLDWTPVHKSERFWKENIKEFESENFKILQELAAVLKSTTNPKIMAIALHDFGEFVKYHPQGRKVVNELGIKGNILSLMEHGDPDVQKNALLCSQKILVQKWEFLNQ